MDGTLVRNFSKPICSIVLLTFAALSGCERNAVDSDSGARSTLTASDLGEQTVLTAAEYRALPEFANANLEYGERLSMQCRACHTLDKNGSHMLGPNLFEFLGRPVGSVSGFPYSPVLSASDFVWTPRALDAWLAAPTEFLRGNSMAYQGLPNEADRTALIASLLVQTEERAD